MLFIYFGKIWVLQTGCNHYCRKLRLLISVCLLNVISDHSVGEIFFGVSVCFSEVSGLENRNPLIFFNDVGLSEEEGGSCERNKV